MELLFVLVIIFGIGFVFRAISASARAAMRSAQGKGSFKENLEVQYKGMGPLQMKIESNTFGEENLPVWEAKIRGLFPIQSAKNLTVITSLFDVTDEKNPLPLIAALDNFQETNTRTFQFVQNHGIAEPNQGYMNWVTAGYIPKDILGYPHSGEREIAFVVRVVDQDNMPSITCGFPDKRTGIIKEFTHKETVNVERGFRERSQEELGVAAASIRLGLAVAYSDGNFDPLEGRLIKEWAAKFVAEIPEGLGRDQAKTFINDAIRFGAEDAMKKNLSISSQVDVLNQMGDKPEKYAAMELCLDVMAADGSADKEEITMLNSLCESLGLDSDRFNELKDHRMMNVESAHMDQSSVWDTLSISDSLPTDEKLKELKKLYRKWNARAESLEDHEEREKAHKMIELIAEARNSLGA